MTSYEKLKIELEAKPKIWLVTGAAGFIGSNIVETLLKLGTDGTSRKSKNTSDPRAGKTTNSSAATSAI